jgi:cell division protein FtsQ
MQQAVPRTGRALPGMPLEVQDPDGEEDARSEWGRSGGARFAAPPSPWWRPASTVGRVFLTLCALIVLGGLGTAGYLLKTYLERDARFRITGASNIQATGLTEVSRAEMLPVFGEDIGRNVFFVPLDERRKQLEAIPWVEHATVMRLLPDQIRVSVVERQPVAFTRQGQQIGLVDANGVLLSMPAGTMAARHYSFPVVTGIDPGDRSASRKARMAIYGRLMAELDANNQHYSQQISEIDLTDPEDARVLMPEQGEDILAHFGEDRFLERYQRYKAHIAEWRQQYPKLAAVDLRYDQQVVLEMASGVTAAQPAAGPDANAGAAKPSTADQAASAPQGKAKPASGKPAATSTPGKSKQDKQDKQGTKPSVSNSAKARTIAAKSKAAKDKAAQNDRKRAEARPAALNTSKRKPSAATRPAVTAAEGQ